MLLNYITWDVSPFIYEGEHFAIGWYGTLWVLGLLGMLITLLITFKHDGVPASYAYVIFMIALVCVIFFAHLFQGLFYEWYYAPNDPVHFLGTDWHYRNHYFEHPWKFLDFAHGGFASHGMIFGIIISSTILSKLLNINKIYLVDRILMGACWFGVTIRTGNLINAEICGVETTMPWGFVFNDYPYALHPTQTYEMLVYLIVIGIVWYVYLKKDIGNQGGLITGIVLTVTMSMRILIEFIKLPQMQIEQNWMLNMGQWLSIPFCIWGVYELLSVLKNK